MNPVQIPCQHIFCLYCLQQSKPSNSCPLCRSTFDTSNIQQAQDTIEVMKEKTTECGCGETVVLFDLPNHRAECRIANSEPVIEYHEPIGPVE